MKIIEPKVELWQQGDDSKAHVARCARVCYGRETGNDEATIKRLINDEHWSTEAIVFENGGFVGILGLSKKLWKKYTEAIYKYRTNTGKMTASDYTHLFGYLNSYYRSAYNVSKRRK